MRCIISGKETKLTTLGHYPIHRDYTKLIADVRDAYQEEQRLKIELDLKENNDDKNFNEKTFKQYVKLMTPKISRRDVIRLAAKKDLRILQMFGIDVEDTVKETALDAAKGME